MPASELSPFADIFPQTRLLELMLLEHTFIKAVTVLCGDYQCDRWQYRKVSDNIAYVVQTRSDSYVVNVDTTDFKGEVSADTCGLMVTLTVLGYLAALMKQDGHTEWFCGAATSPGSVYPYRFRFDGFFTSQRRILRCNIDDCSGYWLYTHHQNRQTKPALTLLS
ncbi:antirestriction protein [Xenorhabdus cabanillasii]|uniref:antirestriction protein n=1 Tax=Xenorhabdus cabanillasii TaxID=351673 RepID=UPI0021001971|nr:antirestriction protein [Xenorhabdus cabanillasii]